MADAPLAFFITLSFYCLFSGDRSGKPIHYLGAGLAAGFVWWIKGSVALVFILVFALYLIRERRLHTKWLIMAAGFVTMLVLNGLVFLVMENDFWKIFRLTTSGVTEYVQGPTVTTDATFYLKLLFLDVKHTWFLGPLAAVGLLLWPRRIGQDDGLTRVALWGIGMVGAFSLFVVSLNPVLFITKQVNYSLVFLAPLALLAGYGLSRLPPRLSIIVAIAFVIPLGTLGTALEQQAIQSFVANSKAALKFATEHPGHEIFGMTNATRVTNYAKLFAHSPTETPQIEDINWLTTKTPNARQGPDSEGFVAYAIFDRQTADWGKPGPYSRLDNFPSCWTRLGDLKPQGMGLGAQAVAALASASALLPGNLGHNVFMRLDALRQPLPATVFGIGPYCLPTSADSTPARWQVIN